MGIGRTDPAVPDVEGHMRVSTGSNGLGFIQFGDDTNQFDNYHIGADGAGVFQIFNKNIGNGITMMSINSDGDMFVAGDLSVTGTINGTTVGTSDQRFKENIAPAGSQLEDVVALGGILKNFDWNSSAPVTEEIRATRQLGLIAQEAEVICPSLVKTIARTKHEHFRRAGRGFPARRPGRL